MSDAILHRVYVAASDFRDFAHAVTTSATPPIQFDIDNDGLLDTLFVSQLGLFYFARIQLGTGAIFNVPPLGVPFNSTVGANRALIQHGDFDDNGIQDLLAYFNGVPIYFPGVAGFNPATPVPTSLNLVSSYEYFTPGDFNKDGVDDAVGVRSNGREDIYLGKAGIGLTSPAFLYPRGFRLYEPTDQESFAISAPSFNPRLPNLPSALTASEGVFYLWSEDDTGQVYSDTIGLDYFSSASFPAGEKGDTFGHALAWGNLDADPTRQELVISAPGRTVGTVADAGIIVWIRYDPATDNLSAIDFDRSDFGVAPVELDRFGVALAAGDFDGNGIDDLAVGTSGDVASSGGAVHVLKGTGTASSPLSAKALFQASDFGANGSGLGFALTTGDFNCDGYEDLAMGMADADVQAALQGGAVIISYGGPNGLATPVAGGTSQRIDKSLGIGGGVSENFEHFGYMLAAGNFNGDSYNGRPCVDLVVASEPLALFGPPGPGGAATIVAHTGSVDVVYGGASGLTSMGTQRVRQGFTLGGVPILDMAEVGDRFGGSLAVTAIDSDGFDDLVIGVSGENSQAGAAQLLRGGSQGITAAGQALWQQGLDKIPGVATSGDQFGWRVGGTSNGLIVIGAPGESYPGPTPTTPPFEHAGWVGLVRVTDAATVGQSNAIALDEVGLSANVSPLRDNGFLGRALTTARPAFVPVIASQVKYSGALIATSGFRSGDLCAGDTTPPVIQSITRAPDCIWPPNKKLVSYRLRDNVVVSADDECDSNPEVRITGVQVVDPKIGKEPAAVFGDTGFCLRADRSGGNTRRYIVTVEARDDHGNTSTATVEVRVPSSAGTPDSCGNVPPPSFVKDGDPLCTF